jgi:hypothetical protein
MATPVRAFWAGLVAHAENRGWWRRWLIRWTMVSGVGKRVGEHHGRVGNRGAPRHHRRTSTTAAGVGRKSSAVRVSTGGRRRGSMGRRGVRGRGEARGGYVGPGGRTEKAGHGEALQATIEVDGGMRLRLARAPVTEAAKRSAIVREWLWGIAAQGGGARLRWLRQLARKREESSGGALDSLNRSRVGKERERRGQHGHVREK